MVSEQAPQLVVGLGNPGNEYAKTRHNLGYRVVQAFAKELGWPFAREPKLKGKIAMGFWEESPLILFLPTTYMNLSGIAVRKVVDTYKVAFQEEASLLVVVDDFALKFGELRLRPKGSSGGHNGLKSIQESFQSDNYARLRLGIAPEEGSESIFLERYVLEPFTSEEESQLPLFIEKGVSVIKAFLKGCVLKTREDI